MRADEAISIFELEDVDYINKIRYERLMAKARHFRYVSADSIYTLMYSERCLHIAEAYEARAKRIKEGM